jgi:hypothetical protein
MRTLAVLAGLLLTGAHPAASQSSGAFGELAISIGGSENVNRNRLHAWWRPSSGVTGRVATPFHVGYLEVGARLSPYNARSSTQPQFDALHLWAGWGLRWQPAAFLALSSGARVGNLRMMFDEAAVAGVKTESELTLSWVSRMDIALGAGLGLFAETTYEYTYTYLRTTLIHGSAGVSWTLRTPGWLRTMIE